MKYDVFFSVDPTDSDESTQALLDVLRTSDGVLEANYLFPGHDELDLKVQCFVSTSSETSQMAVLLALRLLSLRLNAKVVSPHVPAPRYLVAPVKSTILNNGDVIDTNGKVIGKRG